MSMRIAGVLAVVLAAPLALLAQAGGAPQGGAAGGGGAPQGGAGRGAAAPANYPPYTRPVTNYVPPRTPDGQPDISGIYVGISLPRNIETPLSTVRATAANRAGGEYMYGLSTRVALPEGAIARPAGVDPADGKIPLKPDALARRKEIMARQTELQHLDGRVLCLIPGVPRITIPQVAVGYQIFQKPGYVVIAYEQSHLHRTIPLDDRPALDPNIRKGLGSSRGHWEGNVLVVEVTNFTTNFENNWIMGSQGNDGTAGAEALTSGHGIPHSAKYRVTERYTPIDANVIHYEAKITDEDVFTQPWTVAWYAFQRAPKEYIPLEYACFEGNDKNILLMTNTDVTGVRVDVP